MASAPASAQNPRRAPAVAPKPSRITMKRYDDHELKQKPTLLQGSDVSSITEVTGSRRPPPVATKLSRISIKQNYNHELKQEPSLLQSSNVYEESLQFTCKYSEEIMSRSNTFVSDLQQILSTVQTGKQYLDEKIVQQKEQMKIKEANVLQHVEDLQRRINELTEVNELQSMKITELSIELQQRKHEKESVQNHDKQVFYIERKISEHDEANAGLESSKIRNETELKNISAVSLDIEERCKLHLQSEIHNLQQQIEKQRQNQLAAEKFSHEEITKLEDELEEHKRIQTTVGEFAKINSDKLKVHLQEQISRRRFAEKYANEEIVKLEQQIQNQRLKQLEAEKISKEEIAKLETVKEMTEKQLKLVQRLTETRLNVLANLIALQEKRVKGLETNNARYEQGDPPELLNDNGSQTDVVKQLKEEEMKKMQAMKKPAKGRVFSDKERQQFQEILLNESYFEAGFNACIQKAEEREIKEPIEWSMNKMGGYLNVSRFGWNKLFVVVSRRHVIFFKSLGEKQTAEPVLKLDIGWIQDARHYRETDDHELKDLPRIFVLLYDVAGERLYDQLNTEKKGSKYHADKGHLLQDVQTRSPKKCATCNQFMWSMLQPPQIIKCTRCNTKRLTLHFDNFDDNVRPGHRIPIGATAKPADGSNLRRLFLQAESHDMKEDWITHIKEKVRQFLESSSGHKTEYFGGKVI
ncbi:rho-associated protein kinase 2-like isoform X1 [Mya arenaria]|uniref:rho-associated protein kinase 2-like isoform X1 n=1 Tax=Mya arenaria TaxID=6604 RepID=UPI0022E4125D|nr:rho-associated protein kinase 2-like isoform X1 [Mya arenaria]XP_052764530.1 rho-associated protein kinase 2-like isoform X1 [Mya arenaria]